MDSGAGDDAADLGPAPQRLEVDPQTVRRLVCEQFPAWGDLDVAPVPRSGWDNLSFRLGEDKLVRLPSATEYALAVEKEQRWLPRLATQLPVPVPTVLALGGPGAGYPFAWSVYGWIDGTTATFAGIADQLAFAGELADFLLALRAVDPTDGPRPGVHNWHRGGTLRTFDGMLRRSLDRLAGRVDTGLARELWAASLAAPWDGDDTWLHGDLAQGNLLLRDGHLAAVIDFGTCGVGDPSCDLAVAWTLLDEPGREAFRERLGVDDASWARGRGWALWKTLADLASTLEDDDADPEDVARLERVWGVLSADPCRQLSEPQVARTT